MTSSRSSTLLATTTWPTPGAPAGVTAFVDVAVVPMDKERVLQHQTVLVDGDSWRPARWWAAFTRGLPGSLRMLSLRRWSERTVIAHASLSSLYFTEGAGANVFRQCYARTWVESRSTPRTKRARASS